MKYLTIIRHGSFDEGSTTLNQSGQEQMNQLIPILQSVEPEIYSSLGPRSIESARRIAATLGEGSTALEYFGDNTRNLQEKYYKSATEKILNTQKNIVIVSKGEWTDGFISYYCQ